MEIYRFGDFELDLGRMQLRANGQPVRLERRPLDFLLMLVRADGRMVSREELIASLWPANVVIDFDAGLNTLVHKVRGALGDSATESRFVETIAGRGYRFMAQAERVESAGVDPDSAMTMARTRPTWIQLSHWPVYTAIVVVLTLGMTVAWQLRPSRADSVAVSIDPFSYLGTSEDYRFWALGLTEETGQSLAQISNLRLIAAGSNQQADYVLRCTVQTEIPSIRVACTLTRVADGEHIWNRSFPRESTQMLGLQLELARAIAEQLRLTLSPEVAAAIARRQSASPEAYELYTHGRAEWSKFQRSSNERALRYYQDAVQVDSDYALAWAGIAHLLATSIYTADASKDDVGMDARDALNRAMRLDSGLAEVWYAKGYIDFFLDWDLAAAAAAARRAVDLDPNSATAFILQGLVLAEQHSDADALASMTRARELDSSALTFALSSVVAAHANQLSDAEYFARQAVEGDVDSVVSWVHLGNALVLLEDYASAVDAFERANFLSAGRAMTLAPLANALARGGNADEARAILQQLEARSATEHVPKDDFAEIYAGLGEFDLAFAALRESLDACELHVSSLRYTAAFVPLRGDPRWDEVLRTGGADC